MKTRLEIARDLLSEDGVIFVQCDDNEQAYLSVIRWVNVNQFYFSSKVAFKGV
jgi:adenine-specific DNA-methyltransferase